MNVMKSLEKENYQAERLPPRTCLSNRINRNNMVCESSRAMMNRNNNDSNNPNNETDVNNITPYASFVNLAPGQVNMLLNIEDLLIISLFLR
ncbi:unnamed protein product [Schistosoma margrebowiei]|uniref:Uncharacterized protein n=1 Tax=Schistosoma margrebowiei TaxID=48269 RepID=A0A183M6W7_9TREM|nr:unnamed protein product [Schistosoma margrebowiei]